MADNLTAFPITTKKISEFAAATALDGSETITLLQAGAGTDITLWNISWEELF